MLLLILLVLLPSNTYPGGVCSSSSVKTLPSTTYSSSPALVRPDLEAEQKQKKITDTVNGLTLAVVYMLHSRVDDKGYAGFRLDPDELWMFREAVRVRYEENREAIEVTVRESVEKHRQAIHRESVQRLKRERRRRIAWRSDDSFKRAAPKLATIPSETMPDEGKDERKDPV